MKGPSAGATQLPQLQEANSVNRPSPPNPFLTRVKKNVTNFHLINKSPQLPQAKNEFCFNTGLELAPFESLTKLPITGRHVEARHGFTVTGGDLKREALAIEVGIALPVLAPVP